MNKFYVEIDTGEIFEISRESNRLQRCLSLSYNDAGRTVYLLYKEIQQSPPYGVMAIEAPLGPRNIDLEKMIQIWWE